MVFFTGKKGTNMMNKQYLLLCGCIWFVTVTGFTGEKSAFLPIKDVPDIIQSGEQTDEQTAQAEAYDAKHNIAEIEKTGLIYRIAEDEIIINSKLFRLAQDVMFYSETNEPLAKKHFQRRNIVGWRVNMQGEISKLWKLADEPEG
jgi:hypothetical protein